MLNHFNSKLSYETSFKQLVVEFENNLLWIYLNRPENSNAFSLQMIDELTSVLKKANYDQDVRVIIISGMGKAFCAGGDIKEMEEKNGMFAGEPYELRENYSQGIQEIPRLMNKMQKPIIAMVNGAAVGAGCGFACMADIRIASTNAKFAETFSKLALVPGDGGTYFLQRVVGFSKACEMFFTGELYNAEEALKFGLVNIMTTPEELKEKTRAFALKIAQNAPTALALTKRSLIQAYDSTNLENILDSLAAYQGITQRTQDHYEGLKAFHEKRKPNFEGK